MISTVEALSPADMGALRKAIDHELAGLFQELAMAWQEMHDLTRSQGQENWLGTHLADVGAEMEQQQEVAARINWVESWLGQCKDALARMEMSVYGVCVDCGLPIPFPRLRALPTAVRDIECQRRFEARPKDEGCADCLMSARFVG
ncbi:MAG: TraR/DksA C4-type zinc finger protein [Chloroflexi bacterium]|nr:TraR/DksA C4-type zinc finger protein [Chloroflexota bacterium]